MKSSWKPDRPVSKGATAYHTAVANTSWHKENIQGIKILLNKTLGINDVIIDFGAGTGSSSIYLTKYMKPGYKLLLVDNSPSWLGYAYHLLHSNKNISFFVLEKSSGQYETLDMITGKEYSTHVISANTVHLIHDINEAFKGVYDSLKKDGVFIFQSGNIINKKNKNILMIEDTVSQVHDIAIQIIKSDDKFIKYKRGINKKIKNEKNQRKFVFPDPRPIEFYIKALKSSGFKDISVTEKEIKVKYKDWLNFLKVRRLQAGILPEIGGKDATKEEEEDRNKIIEISALRLFEIMKKENKLATKTTFTAQWTYVFCKK